MGFGGRRGQAWGRSLEVGGASMGVEFEGRRGQHGDGVWR